MAPLGHHRFVYRSFMVRLPFVYGPFAVRLLKLAMVFANRTKGHWLGHHQVVGTLKQGLPAGFLSIQVVLLRHISNPRKGFIGYRKTGYLRTCIILR
jgi:hypothetical protein